MCSPSSPWEPWLGACGDDDDTADDTADTADDTADTTADTTATTEATDWRLI